MIPAGLTFINALNENKFRKQANIFLDNHVSTLPYGDYLVSSAKIKYNGKLDSQLLINPIGLVQIDSSKIQVLEQVIFDYDKLKNTKLIVFSRD